METEKFTVKTKTYNILFKLTKDDDGTIFHYKEKKLRECYLPEYGIFINKDRIFWLPEDRIKERLHERKIVNGEIHLTKKEFDDLKMIKTISKSYLDLQANNNPQLLLTRFDKTYDPVQDEIESAKLEFQQQQNLEKQKESQKQEIENEDKFHEKKVIESFEVITSILLTKYQVPLKVENWNEGLDTIFNDIRSQLHIFSLGSPEDFVKIKNQFLADEDPMYASIAEQLFDFQ